MVKFDEKDMRMVTELQAELTTVLLRANEQKVEAALAAFACCRCARILLDAYPADTRAALMEAIEPFLRGELAMDADMKPTSLIIQ